MATNENSITDANYTEKFKNANGVLMFYKKLCPACRALSKMLDKFFAANPDVPFMRIDGEECPEAVKSYNVERIPTLFVLRDGKIAARKKGLLNLSAMIEFYRSSFKQN